MPVVKRARYEAVCDMCDRQNGSVEYTSKRETRQAVQKEGWEVDGDALYCGGRFRRAREEGWHGAHTDGLPGDRQWMSGSGNTWTGRRISRPSRRKSLLRRARFWGRYRSGCFRQDRRLTLRPGIRRILRRAWGGKDHTQCLPSSRPSAGESASSGRSRRARTSAIATDVSRFAGSLSEFPTKVV